MDRLVRRNAAATVAELLASFRIVVLGGARQSGKSTLVEDLLGFPVAARFTLDDSSVRRRATEDPTGFLAAIPRPSVIDEFQRAGEDLLLAVKRAADRDRTRGQLLLTGSASYLAGRGVTETLAGRAGRLVLWTSTWTTCSAGGGIAAHGASPLRGELVRPRRATGSKENAHSPPLPTYSAPGALRQDRGRAAESPTEARTR